ncbi:MAG: hypothetical protein ACOCSD_04960 [Halolamina sp.]
MPTRFPDGNPADAGASVATVIDGTDDGVVTAFAAEVDVTRGVA